MLCATLAACAEGAPAADTAGAAAAPPATGEPWVAYWETEGGARLALDTTRRATTADGALVWTRTTYAGGGPGDPFPVETRQLDVQQHLDCAVGALAAGHAIARDAAGRVLLESPTPAALTFRPVEPATAGAALVALVCGAPAPPTPGGEG